MEEGSKFCGIDATVPVRIHATKQELILLRGPLPKPKPPPRHLETGSRVSATMGAARLVRLSELLQFPGLDVPASIEVKGLVNIHKPSMASRELKRLFQMAPHAD